MFIWIVKVTLKETEKCCSVDEIIVFQNWHVLSLHHLNRITCISLMSLWIQDIWRFWGNLLLENLHFHTKVSQKFIEFYWEKCGEPVWIFSQTSLTRNPLGPWKFVLVGVALATEWQIVCKKAHRDLNIEFLSSVTNELSVFKP